MNGKDPPGEVLALLSAGYWGNAGQRVVVARKGRAEIILRFDNGRYRQRPLAEAEWSSLKRFIEETRFFDLPPLTTDVFDGIQYEAVRVRGDGARRVFMNNPGDGGSVASPYHLFVRRLHRLASFASPVRYDILDAVPGGSLVLESAGVRAVAKGKAGLLVQIEDETESRTWRALAGGKLGDPVAAPEGWLDGHLAELNETEIREHHLNHSPWQARLGDGLLLAGSPRQLGWSPALRWFRPGAEPVVVARGTFAHPIVSPDGRWAVAARARRGGWAQPNEVVRLLLPEGKVLPIDIQAADTLEPIAWIQPHGKVLIRRASEAEDGSEDADELFLVDPETGRVERALGDFRPWFQFAAHLPQPTATAEELWAAIPDADGTVVGRYDARGFTFAASRRFPGLRFDSESIWVDEAGRVVYIANAGSLLQLPLE